MLGKRIVGLLVAVAVAVAGLVGCAGMGPGTAGGKRGSGGVLPLGADYYSFGVSQDAAHFASHIRQAQYYYGLFPGRSWGRIGGIAPYVTIGMLNRLYRVHVRWELKDGRQFIAEDIDVESIMGDYFRTHWLEVQHVTESRPRTPDDFNPQLMIEVRDDKVRLKWRLITHRAPPDQRGKGYLYLHREEFLVAEVPGQPTKGLDFTRLSERP